VDNDGQTLIPPTLLQFAETFQGDLNSALGLDIKLSQGAKRKVNTIFVTLANQTGFQDAAGRFTSEAYALTVDDRGVVITGSSPLGAWWGTRSVIQAAVIGDLSLAKGSGVDAPGWGTRGAMVSYINRGFFEFHR
jgi:hexosaminidase